MCNERGVFHEFLMTSAVCLLSDIFGDTASLIQCKVVGNENFEFSCLFFSAVYLLFMSFGIWSHYLHLSYIRIHKSKQTAETIQS